MNKVIQNLLTSNPEPINLGNPEPINQGNPEPIT